MSRYRIGCTGWGYDDWRGGFYPPRTPAEEYLPRYARVFDVTEVDSTYYHVPSRAQVARWARVTPEGFTFAPKLPGAVTHEASLRDPWDVLDRFLDAMEPLRLEGKLGPLVVQLPAAFRAKEGARALKDFVDAFPKGYRLAVELRHASWWTRETYKLLEGHGAALVWSENRYARTPPVVTSDILYVRLIGDRALTRFDRVQRDKRDEMRRWRERFEDEGRSAREALVVLNNHYMGFAPATAATMREVLGLPPLDLTAAARSEGQKALRDFG